MSIAAALNITVSVPKGTVEADLKRIGATVGELSSVIREAGKDTSGLDDLQRKMQLLHVGLTQGRVNWNTYTDAVHKWSNAAELARGKAEDLARAQAKVHAGAFNMEPQQRYGTHYDAAVGAAEKDGMNNSAAIQAGMQQRLDNERYLTGMRYRYAQESREQATANANYLTQLKYRTSGEEREQAKANANYLMQLKYRTSQEAAELARSNASYLMQLKYKSLQNERAAADVKAAAATELFNEQKARTNQLMANISPYVAHNNAMKEYNALLAAGAMEQAEFNALKRKADNQLWRQSTVMGKAFGNPGQLGAATGLYNPYLVIGASLAMATREAAKFSDSLAMVKAVSDLTADDMQRLSTEALRMGGSSQFSAVQAAEAMKYLAQAGLNANQILAATPAVLDLATAGEMDLANATEVAVRIMGAFHLRADQLGGVVDSLAVGANKSLASVESLGEAMKFVAPVAHMAGLSINETVAALMVLHDQGIPGEMAGTGLRNVLMRLTNPTKESTNAMRLMGIELKTTAAGAVDLVALIHDMHDALEGLSDVDKLRLLGGLGKTRTAAMMMALTTNPADFDTALAEQGGKAGAGHKQAETAMEGLGKQFVQVWNQIKNVGVELIDAFGEGPSNLIKIIKFLVSAFEGFVGTMKVIWDLFKVGFYGGIVVLAKFVQAIAKLISYIPFVKPHYADDMDKWGKATEEGAQKVLQQTLAKTDDDVKHTEDVLNAGLGVKTAAAGAGDAGEVVKPQPGEFGFVPDAEQQQQRDDAEKLANTAKDAYEQFNMTKQAIDLQQIGLAENAHLIASGTTELTAQYMVQTNILEKQKEINKEINSTVESGFKKVNDLRLENEIWAEQHREVTEVDKLLDQMSQYDLTGPQQDVVDLLAEQLQHQLDLNKAKKDFQEQEKKFKALQGDAQKLRESVDPEEAYAVGIARLMGMFNEGVIGEKTFGQAKDKLFEQFVQAQAHNSTANPEAVFKGSAEEFKILNSTKTQEIEFAKRTAIGIEGAAKTLDLMKKFQEENGKPVEIAAA